MQLTLDQIASVAWGAVRVALEDGGVALHRFTEADKAGLEAFARILEPAIADI